MISKALPQFQKPRNQSIDPIKKIKAKLQPPRRGMYDPATLPAKRACLKRMYQTSPRYRKKQIMYTLRSLYKRQGRVKTCIQCKEVKAISDFHLLHDPKHSKSYRRAECKECRKKNNREAYLKRINYITTYNIHNDIIKELNLC